MISLATEYYPQNRLAEFFNRIRANLPSAGRTLRSGLVLKTEVQTEALPQGGIVPGLFTAHVIHTAAIVPVLTIMRARV
jgi:hypothetical protein